MWCVYLLCVETGAVVLVDGYDFVVMAEPQLTIRVITRLRLQLRVSPGARHRLGLRVACLHIDRTLAHTLELTSACRLCVRARVRVGASFRTLLTKVTAVGFKWNIEAVPL